MATQVQVLVQQISASASEGIAREHRITMDRPPAKGGENRGPLGGETILLGLGGCFMSNLLAAVAARQADVGDIRIEITGNLSETPPAYTAIHMKITAVCPDRAQMQKLVAIAERGCIVANTLKNAVDLSIEIA
jgi:putative redox protein